MRFAAQCFSLLLCVGAAIAAPTQLSSASRTTLAEEKQQYIWDMEHASFVIETWFGKPLLADLAAGGKAGPDRWFREDFRGSLPAAKATRVQSSGRLTNRVYATAAPGSKIDAADFYRQLKSYWKPFATVRSARFHVTKIDGQAAAEGLWKVEIRMQIIGAGKAGELLETIVKARATLRADPLDQIKEEAGVLLSAEITSVDESRSATRLFEEVTQAYGLADLGLLDNWELPVKRSRPYRGQIGVADFDGDDYLDIVVATINGQPLLLRNVEGKRFEEVALERGLSWAPDSPRPHEINALTAWIDFDNDGSPDLLLGGKLYRNSGGRFVDVTEASGLTFQRAPSGAMVADFDADGDLDLYIINQKGHERRPPGPRPWVGDPSAGTENQLWRNEGGGRFTDVTVYAGAGAGRHQTFAASTFFYDDDRFPDLYLANDFGANVLLRNRGDGRFEDVTRSTGSGDFATSMGVSAGDLDNDGNVELYVANMYSKMGRRIVDHLERDDYLPGIYDMIRGSLAGSRLYRRKGPTSGYSEISKEFGINEVGWAYAPAMVDFNGDGYLDLYATTGYVSFDRDAGDG